MNTMSSSTGGSPVPPQDFGALTRLAGDARTVALLADEGRHRAVARVFGVPRDQSWIVTLIALGVLAKAVHDRSAPLLRRRPRPPSLAGTVAGASVLNELVRPIGGASAGQMPLFGAIVASAMLVGLSRPVVTLLDQRLRASTAQLRALLALAPSPTS